MAWTTPRTFTANSTVTAADLNLYLRDNFLEMEPAKALNPSGFFATTGLNAIAERLLTSDFISAQETTTTVGTFVDLATVGPQVTVTTSTKAFLFMYCHSFNSSGGVNRSFMAYAVSGATTIAAGNATAIDVNQTGGQRFALGQLVTGLNAGSNVFTAKYTVSGASTGTWSDRRLAVLPI